MAHDIPSNVSFDALARSGVISAPERSVIRRAYDRMLREGNTAQLGKIHVKSGAENVRAGGEALVMGSILGGLHATLSGGLDVKRAPIDGLLGLGLLASSTFMAHEEFGKDLGNMGATCLGILAFRKTNDLIVDMRIKRSGITPGGGAVTPGKIGKASFAGESPSGRRGWGSSIIGSLRGQSDIGEDPIVRAARNL